MAVIFETSRTDFPPNLRALAVKHVTVYILRKESDTSVPEVSLAVFHPTGDPVTDGNNAQKFVTTVDGFVSTRNGNGSTWLGFINEPVENKWKMKLVDVDAKRWFEEGQILDIIFVISYSGERAAWLV